MAYFWIYMLPLLFIPNLGFEKSTPFGTLTVSDYFIFPYLLLVIWRVQSGQNRPEYVKNIYIYYLIPVIFAFLWWSSISTMTIPIRYDYLNLNPVYVGMLKLGKLSLYGLAAVFTIRNLSNADAREYQGFLWAILISGALVGLTLVLSGNTFNNTLSPLSERYRTRLFQDNQTSAMLAILISFLAGMIVKGNGTTYWKRATFPGLLIMIFGLVFAEGRGGWVAVIASTFYIISRISSIQTIRIFVIAFILVTISYNKIPSFREQVDRTLRPDIHFVETYEAGFFGINTIDVGARPRYWITEGEKIINAPLLGTGFFHRGGQSGLDPVGSHNFFIQMLLETGVPGGIMILVVFGKMWQHASSQEAKENHLDLPVKSALVAAIVSGLGGEYFYGGLVLFTLLLTYAPVASLSIKEKITTTPAL